MGISTFVYKLLQFLCSLVKAKQHVLMIVYSRTMNMKRIRPIPLHFISIFHPFPILFNKQPSHFIVLLSITIFLTRKIRIFKYIHNLGHIFQWNFVETEIVLPMALRNSIIEIGFWRRPVIVVITIRSHIQHQIR